MDPLSVAASVLTLISAAGFILQRLEYVKSRMHPHGELLAMMNTVTDLQTTLIVVRDHYEALRDNMLPAARLAYKTLPETTKKLQERLDRLIDFAKDTLLKNGKGLPRLGLSERKRKQLVEIRESISDAHRNLQLVLLTANIRQNEQLMSTIGEISIVQNEHRTLQSEHHAQTSATLGEILSQITAIHHLGGNNSRNNQNTQNTLSSVLTQTIHEGSIATSTQLRITTVTPLKRCDSTCNCQCHVRIRSQTPKWLSGIVGTLFYSSTYTPEVDVRPCNVTTCFRSQSSSSSRFTYYFPSWLIRTALVYSSWNNLNGENSSWTVRMPREIPEYMPCWHYIEAGSVGKIKELLQSREMSPYDITSHGISVLQYATMFWELEICSLLVSMGADIHFKDIVGMSASDSVWEGILLLAHDNVDKIKLRRLIGSEDPYDLCLGPLHRIIVGLSTVDFQMQLDLEPSRINDHDWMGKTPLMWAALRENHTYLRLLLARGARIDLKDVKGESALHFTARAGSLEYVAALLNRGADVNTLDINGNGPLHYAIHGRESNVKNIITLLHARGADIEARNVSGWTPLHNAAHYGLCEAVTALAKCGADVNALDWKGNPPIDKAIFYGHHEIVRYLCEHGTISFWRGIHVCYRSVVHTAAQYGTVKVMDVLSASTIEPVECYISDLEYVFNNHRKDIYGPRCSEEEERAAFYRLLDAKAIPLDSDSEDDEEDNEEDGEEDGDEDDEEDDEENHKENEPDGVFEYALENLSLLNEADTVTAPPAEMVS